MSLVSVIIPYYKKKKYIEKTLFSVISQTYKKTEIIIIYDDQDKQDLKYLKKLKKKDKRIKLIVNKKNIGAGYSRNIGIRFARGKYIAFLDSDDLWHKNKLNNQLKYMNRYKYKISHTAYKVIDMKDNIKKIRNSKTFTDFNQLLFSCDIGLSTVIMDKKIFSKTLKFPNLITKEDYVLWLNILKKGYKIGYVREKLTYWRNLENSLSSSIVQKFKDGFTVYNTYLKFNFLKSLFYLFILAINSLKK